MKKCNSMDKKKRYQLLVSKNKYDGQQPITTSELEASDFGKTYC